MGLQPAVKSEDRIMGAPDASVTLVEFGDYQCPYCGQAAPIVKALIDDFGPSVRFVFRNFPLVDMHPDAMNAALVAESADEKAFWELHRTLFSNQDALGPERLIAYAREVGVSENVARQGLGGSTRNKIESDIDSGNRSGVPGTPAFFINGRLHEGDWSRGSLSRAISEVSSSGSRAEALSV